MTHDGPSELPAPPPLLIYRMGSLGDTILVLPCFHRIARVYADRRRLVLTNVPISGKAAPLMSVLGEKSGIVDGAISYPSNVRSPRALLRLIRDVRSTGADTAIYLMPSRGTFVTLRDVFFLRAAGVKRIIGVPWGRLGRSLVDPLTGEEEQESARSARLLAELGPIDLSAPDSWDLRLTESESAAGLQVVAPLHDTPFLAINMGGKDPRKDWGIARWRELVQRLTTSHPSLGLLIVGAPDDRARGEEIAGLWLGESVVATSLPVRHSAAALSHARAFVGHDSGPLHLATAIGVPTVGIFGDFNRPVKYHPFGAHTIIHEMAGLDHISVDRVKAAVDEALRAGGGNDDD